MSILCLLAQPIFHVVGLTLDEIREPRGSGLKGVARFLPEGLRVLDGACRTLAAHVSQQYSLDTFPAY
jgi:hypothetical protein